MGGARSPCRNLESCCLVHDCPPPVSRVTASKAHTLGLTFPSVRWGSHGTHLPQDSQGPDPTRAPATCPGEEHSFLLGGSILEALWGASPGGGPSSSTSTGPLVRSILAPLLCSRKPCWLRGPWPTCTAPHTHTHTHTLSWPRPSLQPRPVQLRPLSAILTINPLLLPTAQPPAPKTDLLLPGLGAGRYAQKEVRGRADT